MKNILLSSSIGFLFLLCSCQDPLDAKKYIPPLGHVSYVLDFDRLPEKDEKKEVMAYIRSLPGDYVSTNIKQNLSGSDYVVIHVVKLKNGETLQSLKKESSPILKGLQKILKFKVYIREGK